MLNHGVNSDWVIMYHCGNERQSDLETIEPRLNPVTIFVRLYETFKRNMGFNSVVSDVKKL